MALVAPGETWPWGGTGKQFLWGRWGAGSDSFFSSRLQDTSEAGNYPEAANQASPRTAAPPSRGLSPHNSHPSHREGRAMPRTVDTWMRNSHAQTHTDTHPHTH